MDEHVMFILLGLASGAVFASLAMALVVTYRSSGVVNFATGAMALYSSYTYAFLRDGELFIPFPGFPQTVDIGEPLGFVPAALGALLVSALLGLVLHLLVFRPLRAAPAVAKAVASVGVMVVITSVLVQRIGTRPVRADSIFPTDAWVFGDIRISQDRVWFAATVIVVAALLGALMRFTPFGLATRAAAESEKGAYLSGLKPDRIAMINWMLSAVVAGIAGIFIAPIVPLVPIAYTLFIVPALAAAIIGQFQYLAVAVGAGLAIGMLQSEALFLTGKYDWIPAGLPEMIPLALILLVLVVRAKPLPSRGAVVQRTLGRAPRPRTLLAPTAIGVAAATLLIVLLDDLWRAAFVTSLIYGIISLSYVVVTGYAGQISLAQLTLAGVGAFSLATLTSSWGVPFPLAPLIAAGVAALIGVVVGLPAIRIRGLPVAVVTLALAVALEAFWFRNIDFVSASGKPVEGPEFFGIDLTVGSGTADFPRVAFSLTVLATLALVAVGVAVLRRSGLGSAMLAVRANERSAAAAGVNVVMTKVIAFGLGSFIAGLGGAMLAYRQTNVTFDSFTALLGLSVLATAYLAGITSVSGGILAGLMAANGLVAHATEEWIGAGEWYIVLTGVLLIVTVIMNPEGIVGPLHTKLELRRMAAMPSGPEPKPEAAEATLTAVPAPAQASVALAVRNLSVHYGGVVAVDDVSFEVPEGAIVGLIGPNGAGKTTLMDAISGFTPATGSVELLGQPLEGLAPFRKVRRGLGRTFQAIELYDDLSVEENVVVGCVGVDGMLANTDVELERTFDILDLSSVRHRPAGELSQGQRQLVSMARALAGRPKVLLLDEPAGGLDSTESQWLGERLRRVRDAGVTILMVDHDMHLVLNLCDEIRVLDFGKLIASGPPSAIRSDRKVAEAYLGDTHAETA